MGVQTSCFWETSSCKLVKKSNFEAKEKWGENKLENFLENGDYMVWSDCSIQTDHMVDLVAVEKIEFTKPFHFAVLKTIRLRTKRRERQKI